MHYLVHLPNPLDHMVRDAVALEGTSIAELLAKRWPDQVEFSTPHIVLVNGIPALRATWNDALEGESTVTVMAVPFGLETVAITAIALTVGSLLTSALLTANMPALPKPVVAISPVGAPVFTFEGQVNAQRLNQVIEVAYGRNRWYPSYVCAPRIEYTNNLSYLHLWMSLGLGEHSVETVNIGDVPITDIPGCNLENFGPDSYANTRNLSWGQNGWYDKVYTSKVLQNAQLKAPNEDNYAIVGPFPLNPVGTTISRAQINIEFGSGLYGISSNALVARSVTLAVEFSRINDEGMVLEANTQNLTFTATSATAQRFTTYVDLAAGRWQMSIRRTTTKELTATGQDACALEVAYGLGDAGATYKPTTIYARILGTSVAAKDAASKLNVVTTRKIPVYDLTSGTWTNKATRNPIWAILDVLRADYGAQQPDSCFDMTYFCELADACKTTFDHVFNQKTKVWEAVKAIAQSIRAMPYIAGSDYRLAFDKVTDQPIAFFGPDNASDLTWVSTFRQPLDCDSVIATYVDSVTGLEATVQFTPTGSEGVNPKRIECLGTTDRTTAWRTAAYEYMTQVLHRDQITFTAGTDGYIPLFGDLISVSWPFPEWGTAGVVTDHPSANVLTLSDPVTFEVGKKYWLSLRGLDGSVIGPFEVTGTGTTYSVTCVGVNLSELNFDGLGQEPIMYTFGTTTTLSRWFKVLSSSPNKGQVAIEAVAFDPGIFAYDEIDAPVLSQEFLPLPAPTGDIGWIKVTESSQDFVKVQWSPTPGAVGYSIKYTYNPVGIDLMLLRQWPSVALTGYAFNVVDAFATQAFIPRNTGDLAVEVRALSSLSPETLFPERLYWCGIIGDYAQSSVQNRATAIRLLNNDDNLNGIPSTKSQGALGLTPVGTAIWPVGTKYLSFSVDSPDKSNTEVELQWKTDWPRFGQHSYNTWSLKIAAPTGGVVTFTPEMMVEAGWPIADKYYTTVYLIAIVRGTQSSAPFQVSITPQLINYASAGGSIRVVSSAKSGQLDCSGRTVPPWPEGAPRLKTETRLDYTVDVDCTKYGEYQQEWTSEIFTDVITTNRRLSFKRWNYLNTKVLDCFSTRDQYNTQYVAIVGEPLVGFTQPGPNVWSWRERINFYSGQPFHVKLFAGEIEKTVNGKYLKATLVEYQDGSYAWSVVFEDGSALTASDIAAIQTMRRTEGLTLLLPDCKYYSGIQLLTVSCKFRDIMGNESTGFNPSANILTP